MVLLPSSFLLFDRKVSMFSMLAKLNIFIQVYFYAAVILLLQQILTLVLVYSTYYKDFDYDLYQ